MSTSPKFRPHHAKRLLALAGFLEKLPRKRFDYSRWVGFDWKRKADLSCGTPACALGWATTMPRFRKLGLRLGGDGCDVPLPFLKGRAHLAVSEVGEEIFGLDYPEFRYLFCPDSSVGWQFRDSHPELSPPLDQAATPKQVAKHFRKFVTWKKQKEAAGLDPLKAG